MSKVAITKTKLDNLANAIAAKSGESLLLSVDDMTDAVRGITVGGTGEENVIEGIKVNGIELPIDKNKKVNIPAASETQTGVMTPALLKEIFEQTYYYDELTGLESGINIADNMDSNRGRIYYYLYNNTIDVEYGIDETGVNFEISACNNFTQKMSSLYMHNDTNTIRGGASTIEIDNTGMSLRVLCNNTVNEYTSISINSADGYPTLTRQNIINQNNLGNNAIIIRRDLANVAISGDYNDLSNKPTIPSDNIFIATKDVTTSSEINAALTAKKIIFCREYNNTPIMWRLIDRTNDTFDIFYFGRIKGFANQNRQINILQLRNNVWTESSYIVPTKVSDLTNDSGYITTAALPTKISDLTNDTGFITSSALPTKTSDLINDSDFMNGMYIASYGTSTYDEVLYKYQHNHIIYCRAAGGSNPAGASKQRMAFMAYVNDMTTPTEFEFQYYRSMNAHSNTDQGDEVWVYKLNKNSGWSYITRKAYTRIVVGEGLTSNWNNGVLTISLAPTE